MAKAIRFSPGPSGYARDDGLLPIGSDSRKGKSAPSDFAEGGRRSKMSRPRNKRGLALLFTLSVGTVLILLAVSLSSLYSSDVYSQAQQHQAIQAYWLARAGVERYTDSRQVPPSGLYDFSPHGRCSVTQQGRDLIFEGQSGKQRRRILLLQGDPARKVEDPQ